MTAYRYLHFDVFTDRPFSGNQLAVFPDAVGMAPDVMQRIAAEIGFSETTFVVPPEAKATDARVRIFTPAAELPIAGHPTIGTAFALAHEGRFVPDRSRVVFGLGVGPTPVDLEWQANRLAFAWMTQPLPQLGATPAGLEELAPALGISQRDIRDTALPVQVASSGVPLLFVPVASRRAVDAVLLDRKALQKFFRAENAAELPVFVFSLEGGGDDATSYSRMFAPIFGIAEDSATGGAGGPLGGYLFHHGAVSAGKAAHMISLQGVRMGRPSRIHISLGVRNGILESVRVGGQAVLVAEGAMHV